MSVTASGDEFQGILQLGRQSTDLITREERVVPNRHNLNGIHDETINRKEMNVEVNGGTGEEKVSDDALGSTAEAVDADVIKSLELKYFKYLSDVDQRVGKLEKINVEHESDIGSRNHAPSEFPYAQRIGPYIPHRNRSPPIPLYAAPSIDSASESSDISYPRPRRRRRARSVIASPTRAPEPYDPMKAYIGDVEYIVDYSRRSHRNTEARVVYKTVRGEEPKPTGANALNPLEGDRYGKTHAIEVRQNIEVADTVRFAGLEKHPTMLVIHSHYLINAMETISAMGHGATTTPDGSWKMEISEPYELIVRHLDQLRSYKSDYPDQEDLDVTVLHIELLLEFINKAIGAELEGEAFLQSQAVPQATWDWLWAVFKAGETIYTSVENPTAHVVTSITGGTLPGDYSYSGTTSYVIFCWALEFNGTHYRRQNRSFRIPRFKGPKALNQLPVYPAAFHKDTDGRSLFRELVDRGLKVCKAHKASPSHMEYSGWTLDLQAREIQSRVVIDHDLYWRENLPPRPPTAYSDYSSDGEGYAAPRPPPRQFYDQSPYIPHRPPPSKPAKRKGKDDKFADYNNIPKTADLTEHQLLLLPYEVWGWVLKDRKWTPLHISNTAEIIPDKDIFKNLILPEDRTNIIKALVQSHKRRGPVMTGEEEKRAEDVPYSADVVKGKGQGLLVLLHGPPGVGKTSTAECVAEYTERPLFPITCGDLGTDPKGLEEHLQHAFRLAQRWGAVLLLDEADVFLERRELHDINRNSLVSVFLRVLEYYSGILFLTTNRVGSFDEAFTSRLHVSIHYPALKEEERTKIWNNHVNKLERDREDVCIRENVRDYLENNEELKKISFNGRQIRNIFQTAVSLALYEAKIDKKLKGRPTLRSDHLKKVVTLSCEFQDYLESTRHSDSFNAKDSELRDDHFGGSNRKKLSRG